MKLEHIVLNNFRKYEKARFNFHEKFTVLIGENGAGKTTILDALAVMLNTYFVGSGIKTGNSTIRKDDARLLILEKGDMVYWEPQKDVYLTAKGNFRGKSISWHRDKGDRGAKAKELTSLGDYDRRQISEGKCPALPLLLYYGGGRLWDVHRHIQSAGSSSQLDGYKFCLDPKSDHKGFEQWYKKLFLITLQKGRRPASLHVIQHAVLACIPGATDFYFDTEMDQIMIKVNDGLMPFNYLSDGYRNMVAMVADIAHRASRLNPQYEHSAAQETDGVVLIDEIDLHLHPKWQRTVVRDLQKAFPKVQFIVTTHSPFILQSLDAGEVIDLAQDADFEAVLQAPKGIAAPGPASEFSHRSIEDITEEVMGVAIPQRSERYQEMYKVAKQYYALLEKAKDSSDHDKEALKKQLDELSAPFSDNVGYHAFLEMERAAAGFGRSTKNKEDE